MAIAFFIGVVLFSTVISLYVGKAFIDDYFDKVAVKRQEEYEFKRLQRKEEIEQKIRDELRREEEKKAQEQERRLQQPVDALRAQVARNLEDGKSVVDPQTILDKFKTTKLQIYSCATVLRVEEANLRASLESTLTSCGTGNMPLEVVKAIVEIIVLNEYVTRKSRNFQVAGSQEDGFHYSWNLHSDRSNGTASVALMIAGVKFDLAKVVESYTEVQTPYLDDEVVTQLVSPAHYEDRYERRKKPVKVYDHGWFSSSSEWREEEELVQVRHWVPDKFETRTIKKFKGTYTKELIPQYSKNALPPGVSQSELEAALELRVNQEAKLLLGVGDGGAAARWGSWLW